MQHTKNKSYKQRMHFIREKGDMLLMKSDFDDTMGVTVQDIMDCPLSKFIHFAANDCGYAGSRLELVTNWIHPLFLKARSEASKEDNPNWSQAMKGDFADEFWEACK